MCNDFRNRIPLDALRDGFPDLETPGGAPNLQPRDDLRITEAAPVVRATAAGGRELVQLRWSWPGPGGKPVYNFRSDGRRFSSGRCLIPADGFYEFTDPEPPAPKRARKTKWLFTLAGESWFCIAGLIRPGAADGADAFAMLTTEPGPDVAPSTRGRSWCSGQATGRNGWTGPIRRRCCGPRRRAPFKSC